MDAAVDGQLKLARHYQGLCRDRLGHVNPVWVPQMRPLADVNKPSDQGSLGLPCDGRRLVCPGQRAAVGRLGPGN